MLSIRLLGDCVVMRDNQALSLPPSRKTRALLGYLVAIGRPQRRERLCTLLWEVPDDPRGALRWSLSRLRPLVDEPDGPFRIITDRDTVAFAPLNMHCDLLSLRAAARREMLETAPMDVLRDAADGVQGEFLEGLDLPNQPDFQSWCLVLLCHFLVHWRPLLQAAWTPGQRLDQPDGKPAADAGN